jgi:hypothetical protein
MILILLSLFMIFYKKIPLSQFQFLLIICLLEAKTGVFFGDYYFLFLAIGYLLCRYSWYRFLHAPVAQWK